ncbi:hypothetical protein D3C71_1293360 [compost metagenome]
MIVNGEFNVDLCQFRAYCANRIGADNRTNRIGRPARAVFGQRRQLRLRLAFERQENLDVRGGGVCRVITQVRGGEGDAAQVRGNIANRADSNQVGCA